LQQSFFALHPLEFKTDLSIRHPRNSGQQFAGEWRPTQIAPSEVTLILAFLSEQNYSSSGGS
jgi:hypothetical protein